MFKVVFKIRASDKKKLTCNSFVFLFIVSSNFQMPYWMLQNYLQRENLTNI